MDITIEKLSKDNLKDFLYFFDDIAFTDNPDWGDCYCRYYHFDGSLEAWEDTTKADNRACMSDMGYTGNLKGYIAYKDGSPVAWVNANAKTQYPVFQRIKGYRTPEDEKVVSTVCFVIAPGERRKGLATMLLQKVIDEYMGSAYAYIEGYPNVGASSDAHHFHGPLALFEHNGFEEIKSFGNYRIMRKSLNR